MSDKATDKLKDQCLETILSVVPMGQFIFVLATTVILFRIDNNAAASPIMALKDLGIRGLVGFDKGQFWSISALYIVPTFFLALFNDCIFKLGLKRSYEASKVLTKVDSWMQHAIKAMDNTNQDQRTSVHDSISKELDKRIARYRSKRLLCEISTSFGLSIVYASLYMCWRNISALSHISFSLLNFSIIVFCLITGWLYHRSSVKYAIKKIVPYQVYLGASSGELTFFIDIE